MQYQLLLIAVEPMTGRGQHIRPRKPKRRVKLLDLEDGMCRWPLGDPNTANFHFCGCQTNHGPYCAHHTRLAHQERKSAK